MVRSGGLLPLILIDGTGTLLQPFRRHVIDTARESDKSFLKNTAVKRETNCPTFCDVLLICFAEPAAETQ